MSKPSQLPLVRQLPHLCQLQSLKQSISSYVLLPLPPIGHAAHHPNTLVVKALELPVQLLCENPGFGAEEEYRDDNGEVDDALGIEADALVSEEALAQASKRTICLLDACVDILVVLRVGGENATKILDVVDDGDLLP